MMKRTAALLATLACTGAAAPGAASCDTSGWGATARTVVRAAPAPNARMLASIPHRAARERGEDINGTFPEFHINAARNGWFRIDHVSYGDYGDPAPLRAPFAGQGWVHGSQISGQLCGGERFYTGPSERARSRPLPAAADAVRIRSLLDCRGNWVKVNSDIGTGWVQAFSNNQVTTCS